jgi:hypothetical protein
VPFTTFLIDQARRVYQEQALTPWGEGEPEYTTKRGPWFRARLTVRQPREEAPADRGYRYLAGDAELLLGVRDLEGGSLVDANGVLAAFDADDQLEVQTKGAAAPALWSINTGPEPIRRVRGRLLGFKVGLARNTDATVERG